MCSVVGYVGHKLSRDFVLDGLSRLEYRGYDSAGFASYNHSTNSIDVCKSVGSISNLVEKLRTNPIDGYISIGHTRWSTHGKPSEVNAHPHFDCKKSLAVVHNGIIENFAELKKELKNHKFISETDSEVVAHVFEEIVEHHDNVESAVLELLSKIKGAYALVFVVKKFSDKLILIRRKSPLCVGLGKGENFIASDTLAFSDKTDQVIYLPDDTFAIVEADKVTFYDFNGNKLDPKVQMIDSAWRATEKGVFESYMLKEIYEQKNAIISTLAYYRKHEDKILQFLGLSNIDVEKLTSIKLFACGTSWHAGLIGKYYFEQIADIKTEVYLASEARYSKLFFDDKSFYLGISQSGETADTLEVLRLLNDFNQKTAALCNVASSSMVREAKGFLIMQAGPEMAVASTKAFSTQISSLYWLANFFAYIKGLITRESFEIAEENLTVVAELLETTLENYKKSIDVNFAEKYSPHKNMVFLGRGISYPFAMEAALKLKEIAYTFVQTYAAGELKHGPIALIEKNLPVFIFSVLDEIIYQKLLGNVQEVKARGAYVLSFAFEDQYELISLSDDVFILPKVDPLLAPLVMTGVMQYLVYQIAKKLGRSIDKPRNLAKSVTVE